MDNAIRFLYATQRGQIFVLSFLCLFANFPFEIPTIVLFIATGSLFWSCMSFPNKNARDIPFQGFLSWIYYQGVIVSVWFALNFEFLNAVGCLIVSGIAFYIFALIRGFRESGTSEI